VAVQSRVFPSVDSYYRRRLLFHCIIYSIQLFVEFSIATIELVPLSNLAPEAWNRRFYPTVGVGSGSGEGSLGITAAERGHEGAGIVAMLKGGLSHRPGVSDEWAGVGTDTTGTLGGSGPFLLPFLFLLVGAGVEGPSTTPSRWFWSRTASIKMGGGSPTRGGIAIDWVLHPPRKLDAGAGGVALSFLRSHKESGFSGSVLAGAGAGVGTWDG